MELYEKSISVSFTGYRPEKIRRSSSNPNIEREIKSALGVTLKGLYDEGYRNFFSGMAEGFDLWAAEEVLRLRDEGGCTQANLIAVVPFRAQAAKFTERYKSSYQNAIEHSAEVMMLSERYYPGCFEARNNRLIESSSVVVCYFDGQSGGTKYTVGQARKKGLRIINLFAPSLF